MNRPYVSQLELLRARLDEASELAAGILARARSDEGDDEIRAFLRSLSPDELRQFVDGCDAEELAALDEIIATDAADQPSGP